MLPRLIPGDAVQLMLAETSYAKDIDELRAKLGLDRPFHVQYVEWLARTARGDLGESLWTRRPVLSELAQRLPVTGELALYATVSALLIALPIGVVADARHAAGGAAPGLRAHGVGERTHRARGGDQTRAAQRGDPGHNALGHAAAAHPGRHRHHRADLRAARREPLPLRRHQPARLSGDPGREPARRLHGRARQPRGRRALCRARSADPLLSATTSATLELNGAAPAPAGARPRTVAVRWALAGAHFARRKPLGAIGGMIVLAMLVMAVLAEQVAP